MVVASYDDALVRDGEMLALVGSEVVLLSELASALVSYARSGASVASLADSLVADFGAPPEADPIALVSDLVRELLDHGVLRAA